MPLSPQAQKRSRIIVRIYAAERVEQFMQVSLKPILIAKLASSMIRPESDTTSGGTGFSSPRMSFRKHAIGSVCASIKQARRLNQMTIFRQGFAKLYADMASATREHKSKLRSERCSPRFLKMQLKKSSSTPSNRYNPD
jgi:hypothetical protein